MIVAGRAAGACEVAAVAGVLDKAGYSLVISLVAERLAAPALASQLGTASH